MPRNLQGSVSVLSYIMLNRVTNQSDKISMNDIVDEIIAPGALLALSLVLTYMYWLLF